MTPEKEAAIARAVGDVYGTGIARIQAAIRRTAAWGRLPPALRYMIGARARIAHDAHDAAKAVERIAGERGDDRTADFAEATIRGLEKITSTAGDEAVRALAAAQTGRKEEVGEAA